MNGSKTIQIKVELRGRNTRALKQYFNRNKALITSFGVEVHVRARQIDINEEYDWWALTYGWAIAKGLTPRKANFFATFIRYNTNLG